jgi:hypothetical protein
MTVTELIEALTPYISTNPEVKVSIQIDFCASYVTPVEKLEEFGDGLHLSAQKD